MQIPPGKVPEPDSIVLLYYRVPPSDNLLYLTINFPPTFLYKKVNYLMRQAVKEKTPDAVCRQELVGFIEG